MFNYVLTIVISANAFQWLNALKKRLLRHLRQDRKTSRETANSDCLQERIIFLINRHFEINWLQLWIESALCYVDLSAGVICGMDTNDCLLTFLFFRTD